MTSPIRYYDAHCHLQDPRLADRVVETLAGYAREGVARVVVNGTCEADWEEVARLARLSPIVKPSFGLHPWKVDTRGPDWRERLLGYWENGDAAVGEIGLDRWIEGHDISAQTEVFLWQLRWAAENGRPVSIHCLKAWGLLLELLRAETALPRFLLHSYGGPIEMVPSFAALGAFFSISGYFFHERKAAQAAVFAQIPIGRLLVETDAPDMRGPSAADWNAGEFEANHPLSIVPIYGEAARLRSLPVRALADQAAANFEALFGSRTGRTGGEL